MATLTYFTAKLNLEAVVADTPDDLDAEPQTKGIYGGVTITPVLHGAAPDTGIYVRAATLTPAAALLVLASVDARIDNGQLKLRADPDRPVLSYANLAAFPGTGDTTKLYRALDTTLVYQWNGSAYVAADNYATVRLVAQTAVLALPAGVELRYRFDFDHVTFNGGPQQLPPITVAAPTSDVVLDLAIATWLTD